MAQIVHDESLVDVIIIPFPLMKKEKVVPLEDKLKEFGNGIHINQILEIAAGVHDPVGKKLVSGVIVTLTGSLKKYENYVELNKFLGVQYPGSYVCNGKLHTQES